MKSAGAQPMQVDVLEHWIYIRIPAGAVMGDLFRNISQAPKQPDRKLLIDVSALDKLHDSTSHALLGEHMALHMSQVRKVALLVGEDIISYNSERTARRMGLDLRVFTERGDAERWLMS